MDRRVENGMKTGMKALVFAAASTLALAGALSLAACSDASTDTKESTMNESDSGAAQAPAPESTTDAYHAITASEAQYMISTGGDITVVDVRTPQEYAEGHIPGAINIPLDSIGSEQPAELGNLDAELIVYCRTGVRSKQASDKLIDLGYRYVNDMGGIVDWPGDVVSGDQPT